MEDFSIGSPPALDEDLDVGGLNDVNKFIYYYILDR
jgi:hypothetical protein